MWHQAITRSRSWAWECFVTAHTHRIVARYCPHARSSSSCLRPNPPTFSLLPRRPTRLRHILLAGCVPSAEHLSMAKSWTSADELVWLRKRVSLEDTDLHARAGTLPQFKQRIFNDFLVAFPLEQRRTETDEQFATRKHRLPEVCASLLTATSGITHAVREKMD